MLEQEMLSALLALWKSQGLYESVLGIREVTTVCIPCFLTVALVFWV